MTINESRAFVFAMRRRMESDGSIQSGIAMRQDYKSFGGCFLGGFGFGSVAESWHRGRRT